jgi:sec-independent protein translocase protein TatC
MTIVEHLTELRRRIFISLIAVALGGIVCFIFSNSIISFLVHYYKAATHGKQKQLVFTGPLDAFLVRLKIATYGGIALAVPVWMWQLWRFVTACTRTRSATPCPSSSRPSCSSPWAGGSRC